MAFHAASYGHLSNRSEAGGLVHLDRGNCIGDCLVGASLDFREDREVPGIGQRAHLVGGEADPLVERGGTGRGVDVEAYLTCTWGTSAARTPVVKAAIMAAAAMVMRMVLVFMVFSSNRVGWVFEGDAAPDEAGVLSTGGHKE
jgi:hypothetical protein